MKSLMLPRNRPPLCCGITPPEPADVSVFSSQHLIGDYAQSAIRIVHLGRSRSSCRFELLEDRIMDALDSASILAGIASPCRRSASTCPGGSDQEKLLVLAAAAATRWLPESRGRQIRPQVVGTRRILEFFARANFAHPPKACADRRLNLDGSRAPMRSRPPGSGKPSRAALFWQAVGSLNQ